MSARPNAATTDADRNAPGAQDVALLAPCYRPEVRRGGERFVHDLARGLIARGHRPRLITSHPEPTRRDVEDGLPIVRLHRPPEGRLQRRKFEPYLSHVPLSYLELRRGPADVAHATYATDALAAARWTARTGRPSVLSYLGIPDRPSLMGRRARLQITQRALAGCTAVTALSHAAADAFRRTLGYEARVIHPGVDLEAFRPGEGRAPEPTIFCGADVGVSRKRVGMLVEAFRLLLHDRPTARLVLSRPADPGAAERLGLDHPAIELASLDDTAALAGAYRRAWVTALPSFGEAFGLVLAESLACGTPVVGTDSGAIPEVVDRTEVGRLFAPDDPADLARALLEALELAEDGPTPAACRARAEDFGVDRCADAYEALYRELLER